MQPPCLSRSSSAKCEMIKILILGDDGVGKSALFERYCRGKYAPNWNDMGFVHYCSKTMTLTPGERISVVIWDLPSHYFSTGGVSNDLLFAHGIILCYSTTSRSSFDDGLGRVMAHLEESQNNQQYHQQRYHQDDYFNYSRQYKNNKQHQQQQQQQPAIALVGTKCDAENDRAVSHAEGLAWAAKNGCVGFQEASAKDNVGVDMAFLMLLEALSHSPDDPTKDELGELQVHEYQPYEM